MDIHLDGWFIVLCSANAMAFLYYGYNCLFSEQMAKEFKRFQLSDSQRQLTGALQIFGALGVLIGLYYNILGALASAGLCLLMLFGFVVRLKIKDSFALSVPSFIFMLLNGYLAWYFGNVLTWW
jgi:hypothetical protein